MQSVCEYVKSDIPKQQGLLYYDEIFSVLICVFQSDNFGNHKGHSNCKNNRGNKNCLACKTNFNVIINCRFSKLRSGSLRFLACEIISFLLPERM